MITQGLSYSGKQQGNTTGSYLSNIQESTNTIAAVPPEVQKRFDAAQV